jgi:hypothetical protein
MKAASNSFADRRISSKSEIALHSYDGFLAYQENEAVCFSCIFYIVIIETETLLTRAENVKASKICK